MGQYKFEVVHKDLVHNEETLRVTMKFYEENLFDVIAQFEAFLRGAGFYLPEGHTLDFVREDDPRTNTKNSTEDNS